MSGHTNSLDDTKAGDLEAAGIRRRRRTRQPLEDSVYPEVQASVSNIDDPTACVLTLRVWFLGLLFCLVISALNTYFVLRYPAPLITPIITQIFAYPFGRFLAKYMPAGELKLPTWAHWLGMPQRVSLNPGPFSIKEHALLVIMANVSTSPALALNYSVAAEKFYGEPQPFGFDILVVLTTQLIGFGAAGLCRRFLVWPASMLWPQNLVFCTLLNTFHAEIEDEEPGPSRLRFFAYVFVGAFCYFWLPGFLFVALSAFSWVCWIAPNNVVVNQLFGVSSGLGMGLFSFDWSQIAYIASPLVVPWWAQLNIFGGFFVAFWIVAPIMYYTNSFNAAYLPMSTSSVFDRFGQVYDTARVLDAAGLELNVTAYNDYSPVYMPVTYLVSYGTSFMLATGILVHTILFNGPDIWNRLLRQHVKGDVDIHMKLMRNYPDVPDWAYLAFLLAAFALSAVTVSCWPTGMPAWALVVSLAMGLIYIVPAGYVYALTSYNLSINVIAELVGGYMMTDKPLANILFKIYTANVLNVGLFFAQDLKLGHYMKIPPRETFKVQVIAVVVTSFAQVGVKRWLISTVPTLCDADQSAQLTCPNARTMFSASVIWGLIGPARLFSYDSYYHPLLYWMIGGAVVPTVSWLILRRWPHCWLRYFHLPIALTGLELVPPASGINFSSSLIVGFIFQYLVRRINFDWWSKYNFVLSAAMDAGTIVCGILIFLTLQLPRNGTISVNWWGNEVFTKTLDWAGVSFKTVPPEGFGTNTW
ncbi:OPT oligopeptide transporter [Rhodotorula sp. JG-1b]|nr:OPT oligopeptide transporter [Rhodotorula sp. JG-1b]